MDSLNAYVNAALNDTDRVRRINTVYFNELWKYNSAEPYKMLKEALALSKKNNFTRGELMTYKNMVGYCRNKGHRPFVIKYSKEYTRLSLFLKDTISYAGSLVNQAINYMNDKKPDSAMVYLSQGLDIYLKCGANKDQLARVYYQLARNYSDLNNVDAALLYANKSLSLREEINYADGIDASLNQIAGMYSAQKNYPKIIEYAGKALQNRMAVKDSARMASYTAMIGHAQAMQGKYDSAFYNLYSALSLQKRIYGAAGNYQLTYQQLSEACEKSGDSGKALEYYKMSMRYKDSSYSLDAASSMSKAQVLYDVEEKENQIKLLDQEKKMQQYGLVLSAIVLLAVIFISFFIYKAYQNKKQANVLLEEQKKVIEEKNREVMDSINYAKRIQTAILLPEQELQKHFTDIFVLFKPRDIVSGDFYWFSQSAQNKIIAVADCTGHGVPGAFMSMLGYESLQDVALKESIATTSDALKSLDKKITDTLNKSDRSFRDGMDLALCAFSNSGNKLQYSGANRPLIHISDGKLTEYRPDKNTIGGDIDNIEKLYSTKHIEYKKGDMFYLFTDGFADQFGGEKGKKFKYRNLQSVFQNLSALPLKEQKRSLEKTFESWKGSLEQLDDVCVIGIRM
jgi:serine phosphatase RsbU (regulator of sigma subunit)